MLVSALAWVLSTAFVTLLAYLLARFLGGRLDSLFVATFLFLWIFLVTAFLLLMGLIGLLSPVPLLLASLLGLVILLVPGSLRTKAIEIVSDLRKLRRAVGGWWSTLPIWLRWLTGIVLLVSVLRFAALILIFPPFVWDSLTYHLTNVAEWTQRGRIMLFDTSMTRIYTPANYETFTLWFTVFIHHDVVVEMAGLPAYALAVLSVYVIARRLDFSRSASWLGALTFASTPALLLATTGTKNDPHIAAYYLFALAVIVALFSNPTEREQPNLLGQLTLLAVTILYAFGTKAYIAHILPGILIIAAIGVKKGQGWQRWRDVFRDFVRQLRNTRRLQLLVLVLILITGMFLGLFWNARNWVLQGNPFYPYGIEVGNEEVLPGAERDAEISFSRLRMNYANLFLDKFGDKQSRIVPDLDSTTGWGWFVYSMGIPALVLGCILDRRVRVLAVGFVLSLTLIFFSIRPSPWNMRYLLWFPALFGLSFSWLLDELMKAEHQIPQIAIRILTIITLSMNFVAVLNYGRIPLDRFEAMLAIPLLERDAASLRINMPVEYENSLKIIPEEALLGYNLHSNGFIYPLYRADFAQHLVYIPISTQGTCFDVAEAMRTRGTRYLFVAPEHTSDSVISFLNECGESEIALRERTGNLYVLKD